MWKFIGFWRLLVLGSWLESDAIIHHVNHHHRASSKPQVANLALCQLTCMKQWLSQTHFHVSPCQAHCIDGHIDAADAETPLKDSELQVLRSQYLKEQEAEHITIQTKFNYAWGLVKSDTHDNQLEGVRLLTGTH
jgi:hypothetical protein